MLKKGQRKETYSYFIIVASPLWFFIAAGSEIAEDSVIDDSHNCD
jgi:hypothetical protein